MESGRPLNRNTTTGLPVASIAAHQFFLPAHQVEAGAVAQMPERPGFARSLLVAADGEHDDIGALRHFDGFGDLPAILSGSLGVTLVLHPGAADR